MIRGLAAGGIALGLGLARWRALPELDPLAEETRHHVLHLEMEMYGCEHEPTHGRSPPHGGHLPGSSNPRDS